MRELGNLDFFGLMKKNEDREKVMEEVDKIRAKSIYSHPPDDCSDACKTRGEIFLSLVVLRLHSDYTTPLFPD